MALKLKSSQIIIGFILVAFVSFGLFNLLQQNTIGMEGTNLSGFVPWGIYIVNFTVFLGGGAAVLIYMLLSWKEVSKNASSIIGYSLLAFMVLSLSGIFILADLGRIDRFFFLIIYAQPSSPLFVDFLFMNVALGISTIYLLVGIRLLVIQNKDLQKIGLLSSLLMIDKEIKIPLTMQQIIRFGSILLLTVGYILTTELFAGMKSSTLWHSPTTILNFSIDTLLTGIVLIFLFIGKKSILPVFQKSGLFLLIIINLGFIILMHLNSTPFSIRNISLLIILNLLPLLFLLMNKNSESKSIKIGAFLLLVGLILERALFINAGFIEKWIPYPDKIQYFPSIMELSITCGFYCGLFLFWSIYSIMINNLNSNKLNG